MVLSLLGLRDRLTPAFTTEFFIKTGLVLLGSTVLFDVIVQAAGPAVLQALFLVTSVFLFAWWIGGRLGPEFKLGSLREAGWRPIGVFAAATAFNLLVGLLLAVLFFRGFTFQVNGSRCGSCGKGHVLPGAKRIIPTI